MQLPQLFRLVMTFYSRKNEKMFLYQFSSVVVTMYIISNKLLETEI